MATDPEATPRFRLLAAAASLAQAATGVIEAVHAMRDDHDLAPMPADGLGPLDDELDAIASAIGSLHFAQGEPPATMRLNDAAERWIRGED